MVADILADIKKRGDEALLEYTRRFDHLDAMSVAELEMPQSSCNKPCRSCPQTA